MLQRLVVSNFILAEHLALDFEAGVCVLTGETGAGKSIVIDALAALMGGKAGADCIRTGSERARLEATFRVETATGPIASWLEAAGLEPAIPGELSLAREITVKGSRHRVEGMPVSQALMRELGELLVDILGQHEHTLLLRPREHLAMLDRFGGHLDLVGDMEAAHRAHKELEVQLRELELARSERERQQDLWRFQLGELEAHAPQQESEPETLRVERDMLLHVDELRAKLEGAYLGLTGADEPGVLTQLGKIGAMVREAAVFAPDLSPLAEVFDEAMGNLEDVCRQLRHRSERLEGDPERLNELEGRLDQVRTLLRKYGPTVADCLAFRERVRHELERAVHVEELLESAEKAREEAAQVRDAAARALTRARREAAERLEQAMRRELDDLGMTGALFEIAWRDQETPAASGAEAIEFLLAPNPGEPPRPLARTASGGELSRLMLAMKTVLVRADAVGLLVFDEVDSGISGRTALIVAQKIAQLGTRRQILLITHMPAIAAIAEAHYHVEKRVIEGRTYLQIDLLDAAGRVTELAQLASGDASSEAASEAARELLSRARQLRQAEVGS